MNVYEAADKAIREMNRANLKAFSKLKLAKWDELHVIRQVDEAYAESIRLAKKKYMEIAWYAYIHAMYECGKDPEEAKRMARRSIDRDWLLDLLEEADHITLYIFMDEAKRKEQRLLEALSVTMKRNEEIDKALKLWTRQVGQYSINVTDAARLQAFRDAGIKKVKWITQEDERVCHVCGPMHGRVYPIDMVPAKPHINCRCELHPVLN